MNSEGGFGAVVLPMTVSTNDEGVFLLREEFSNFIAFVFKSIVGVIVFFVFSVGANDWGGADQNSKGGIRIFKGFKEP